jgi:hypothetical protein
MFNLYTLGQYSDLRCLEKSCPNTHEDLETALHPNWGSGSVGWVDGVVPAVMP